MTLKSFFATSLVVTAFTASMYAQTNFRAAPIASLAARTPAADQDGLRHTPDLSSVQMIALGGQAPALDSKDSRNAKEGLETLIVKQTALIRSGNFKLPSRSEGLCYAVRTSKFSEEDLAASAPHASTQTTCTPASGIRMKTAEAVQTK